MFWLKTVLLLLVLMMLPNSQKTSRIATGVWGGLHIQLEVAADSAKVEFDCAHGVIEGPLVVDAQGNFELCGSFTQERGGPIRADEKPQPREATYSGTIKGDTMKLTLKVAGVDEAETFTLEHNKPGDLVKCK